MGYKLNLENMNLALNELKKTYKILYTKVFVGAGTFSDTDRVRYGEIESFEEIENLIKNQVFHIKKLFYLQDKLCSSLQKMSVKKLEVIKPL